MTNKLGQLIMTGISGTSLTEKEEAFIKDENIGGVILFAENFESPAQLAELVNTIQKLRDEYPLFISVDHEGGRVIRFKKEFTQFPAMLDISRVGSPKVVYNCAAVMAEELNACGVNVNFAPVCDVLINAENKVIGDRAFGSDHDTVSKFITSVIRGLQTNGVLSCAKHFPGHGNTTKDSHFDLPLVKREFSTIEEEEIPPFVKAIKARVEFVMMAHLQVDSIDSEYPCSLSEKAYTLLRDNYKFKKIVITDDMQMGAITKKYGAVEAAKLAINSGANTVIYRDMDQAQLVYNGLKELLNSGELHSSQVDESFDLVMDAKKRNLAEYRPIYIPEITKKFNQESSKQLLSEIQKSVAQLD